jgi:hypothetical protein
MVKTYRIGVTLGAREGSPNRETGREPTAALPALAVVGPLGDLPAEPRLDAPPVVSRLR